MGTERSLVLLKPDTLQRRLMGALVGRFEQKGLKFIGMKMLMVTKELAAEHYADHVDKYFYPPLEQFVTSGPSLAMVLEGPDAISVIRAMLGKTNGRESVPGTIRGDYGMSQQMNLLHGSDSIESAEREIAIYFDDNELMSYTNTLESWVCADNEK